MNDFNKLINALNNMNTDNYSSLDINEYNQELINSINKALNSKKENEMFKKNQATEKILNSALIGMWVIEVGDGSESRMYANNIMNYLLGITDIVTPEQCYNIWRDGIVDDYIKMVDNGVEEIINKGKSEITYLWKHPTLGDIYVRCGGILDNECKEYTRIYGYHQNISDLMGVIKRQEKQIMDAMLEARMANRVKDEFLSHMSHDIRTPINGIIGMIDIAQMNENDIDKTRECREKIKVSANHLLSLINDILDISKLESGTLKLERESFDLRQVIDNTMTILSPQAKECYVTIIGPNINVKDKYLVGSPLHLRQILINIVSNAIKYNKAEGKVSIEVNELVKNNNKGLYQFIIKDSGIGMSKEFMRQMFNPFTQERSDARTQYKGTGLGLAISKNLVELMHGTIKVDSIVNHGTTFTIEIPFDIDSDYHEVVNKEYNNTYSFSNIKVLLVEDNDINREITQYILEEANIEVINAINGKEAIDIFMNSNINEFDCIFMDVMMPVIDGYEATRAIRELEREDAKNMPIFALSANAFVEDVKKSKRAGMNEHISKPVDPIKLYEIIDKYCKK